MFSFRSRSTRLKLPRDGIIRYNVLGTGIALGYRTSKAADGPGRFVARIGNAGRYHVRTLGTADDIAPADGRLVLDHGQAVAGALLAAQQFADEQTVATARAEQSSEQLLTVADAITAYCHGLEARGGRAAGEARSVFRCHVSEEIGRLELTALTESILIRWGAGATVYARSRLKSALNACPSASRPSPAVLQALNQGPATPARIGREHVLSDVEVDAIVAKARAHEPGFGLFVAVLAATGARPGQVARARVRDFDRDVLLIPPSLKGRPSGASKSWARVPLPPALAAEVQMVAASRGSAEPLFCRPRNVRDTTRYGAGWRIDGVAPWSRMAWSRAARAADIEDGLYQLRHAAVVRLVTAGVPLRVIAQALDTSVAMLERVYSRYLGGAGEAALRAALPVSPAATSPTLRVVS
jgi:integrase